MAYEGEALHSCPAEMFDFNSTYVIIVSGASLNPKGHMILNTGGRNGIFFHAVRLYDYPLSMDTSQFQRYLRENDKTIWTIFKITIPYPERSQQKLEELLASKWFWRGIAHNCETFTEEIVEAGGGPHLQKGTFPFPIEAANECRDDWGLNPPKAAEGQEVKIPSTQEPGGSAARAQTVKVRSGDTLSGIAKQVYRNYRLWPLLWDANRKTVGSNPNRISSGMMLTIPPLNSYKPADISDAQHRSSTWREFPHG